MDWLDKLDELATQLIPEEDRDIDSHHSDSNDALMVIDPLLDGDLQYDDMKREERSEEVSRQESKNEDKKVITDQEEEVGNENEEFETFVQNLPPNSSRAVAIGPIVPEICLLNDNNDDKANESIEQAAEESKNDHLPSIVHQSTGDVTAEESHKIHSSRIHIKDQTINSSNSQQIKSRYDKEQEHTRSAVANFEPKSKLRKNNRQEITSNSDERPGRVTENSSTSNLHGRLDPTENSKVPVTRNSASIAISKLEYDKKSIKFTADSEFTIAKGGFHPQRINLDNEKLQHAINFDTAEPLQQWSKTSTSLDASKNCMGVVQVRVLAAQHLMCPNGSTVQPVASLMPWKGKVRGECTNAFGHEEKGVCVKWDTLSEASCCSMVHAGRDNLVVPTIKLELIFKPLPLLEFSMCSLHLSCHPLMMQQGIWKKQWCKAELSDKLPRKESGEHERPFILVEAAFFPATNETSEDDNNNSEKQPPASKFVESSTIIASHVLKTNNKLHLFKMQSMWRPAQCSICKRSLVGWKRTFRCETCEIDCCKDCRVQIDFQIPCGSDLARRVVENSIQNKLTMSNILTTIAPVDTKYEKRVADRAQKGEMKMVNSSLPTKKKNEGTNKHGEVNRFIGRFRIKIDQACIFESPLPLETDPADIFDTINQPSLKKGDYYLRVTCMNTSETNRTITVPSSGKPKFSSPEMVFDVPHYGAEYRLEVFDAYNNKPVGTTLLTAQALLQLQRDSLIEKFGLFSFLPSIGNKLESYPTTLKIELRAGIKRGFESTYSLPTKTSKSNESKLIPGSISGWVILEASVQQDFGNLYGPNAIECPSRSPSKLDLELFQLLISRIFSLIGSIQEAFTWYYWLISWNNPTVSAFSLVIFVWSCFRFNLEYIGCLPIMMLVLIMSLSATERKKGRLKQHFIQRQKESCVKEILENSVHRSNFRPVGGIEVQVERGRNLRSQELGISGSVGCHVFWHPLRYIENEEDGKSLISQDKLLESRHDMGETNFVFDVNPEWNKLTASSELLRMQRLSPNLETLLLERGKGPKNKKADHKNSKSVVFPFLRPVCSKENSKKNANSCLEPWKSTLGAIVVQVRFGDVINKLPGFKDTLGEVVIPLSNVMLNTQINGWFQVTKVNSTHTVRYNKDSDDGMPCVHLSLRWLPPDLNQKVSEADREASINLEEEMVLTASTKALSQGKTIGNSLGSLNSTVRGIGGTLHSIQNTIGQVVDLLEACHNIFTFADPQISSLVLCSLLVICLLLALVPTRTIVLLVGLVQYIVTLVSKLKSWLSPKQSESPSFKSNRTDQNEEKETQTSSPISTWITNAFRSIPTDEDLRKTYFWEGRRIGEQACSKIRMEKRITRLTKLWNAKWFSSVKLRIECQEGNLDDWQWQDGYFAVVLGRRLMIWTSETDFDAGEIPYKQLYFSGHAGIAGLSPIELRHLNEDEVKRATNIFGRGENGQLKLMFLLPDKSLKDSLESVIMDTAIKDD